MRTRDMRLPIVLAIITTSLLLSGLLFAEDDALKKTPSTSPAVQMKAFKDRLVMPARVKSGEDKDKEEEKKTDQKSKKKATAKPASPSSVQSKSSAKQKSQVKKSTASTTAQSKKSKGMGNSLSTSLNPGLVSPAALGKAAKNAGNSPAQMGEPGEEKQAIKEFKAGALYRIDYYDKDLIELVKVLAEQFKVNFIISDKVKGGKITILSPNPVTREEAWQAFLSALSAKDLSLVRVGKFYKIIPIRDAQRSPIKTYLEGGTTDPSDEFITYLFKLKYLEIKDIEKILKDLKSKNGSLISFEQTNTMILTDSAINIRRMIKIVNELDLPGGRDAIHVIDIYYADAADIADKLEQIFGEKGRAKSKKKKKKSRKKKKKKRKSKPASDSGSDSGQVTLSNVIADDRTNQLIIVAPRDAMTKILDMINRLDVPIPGDGQVHVYYLENANAEELASTLTGMAGRGSSRKGKKSKRSKKSGSSGDLFEGEVKITADKSTNSLVIVASTKDYNSLKKVIKQLDLRRRQVFVEAVIMEVTLKKDNTLGMAMQGGYTMDIGGETVPIYGATTLGSMSSMYLDPTKLSGLAVGLRGPELSGTEGILGDAAIPSFSVLIQMLQSDSDANVLSTPHILTMDNEEAEIIVGKNVPFITGSARDSNNQPVLSIQRQDVALTMKIKPQINESDYVRLQVQQELTELVSISETLGPTTTKRSAKSTVVVKDNQTIVIGGLLRDIETSDTEKVPLLGDLPILGRLFRRDVDRNEKTNLLIFLTPHIIKDEDDFKNIFKRKMEERNKFLRKFYGTDDEYEFETDFAQKTGLIESIRKTYKIQQKVQKLKDQEAVDIVISPTDGHTAVEIGADESHPPIRVPLAPKLNAPKAKKKSADPIKEPPPADPQTAAKPAPVSE